MHRVFLSYRRDDTQYITSFIREQLESPDAFGADSVFMDLEDIPPGVDFRNVIRQAVSQCEFFLVVIGRQWVSSVNAHGQFRLHDPIDFVRLEIEAALLRNIPVIPVLVDQATLPTADQLPTSLKHLVYKHAVKIRPGSDFRPDIFRLVNDLQRAAQWYRDNAPESAELLDPPTPNRVADHTSLISDARPQTPAKGSAIAELAHIAMQGTGAAFRPATLSAMLAKLIELRDAYTGGNGQRVTRYALALAEQLKVPNEQAELLRIGTPLHDIGKIGIPDDILRKPGRLTAEEYEVMQSHTTVGAAFLSSIPELSEIIPIVRNHHERWDGRGYPDRLANEDIPFLARLVAVCVAFNAMTAWRPYMAGIRGGPEKAFHELDRNAGSAFDPECVRAFLAIREQILSLG